jgi:hypothetical protein
VTEPTPIPQNLTYPYVIKLDGDINEGFKIKIIVGNGTEVNVPLDTKHTFLRIPCSECG